MTGVWPPFPAITRPNIDHPQVLAGCVTESLTRQLRCLVWQCGDAIRLRVVNLLAPVAFQSTPSPLRRRYYKLEPRVWLNSHRLLRLAARSVNCTTAVFIARTIGAAVQSRNKTNPDCRDRRWHCEKLISPGVVVKAGVKRISGRVTRA